MTAEARAARDRLLNEVGQTGLDIAARALAEHPSAAALAAEFGEAGIAALARANGDPTVAARELVRRAQQLAAGSGGAAVKSAASADEAAHALSTAQGAALADELAELAALAPDTSRDAYYIAQTDHALAQQYKFDWQHVLQGEIGTNGKATGFHAEFAAEGASRITPGATVTHHPNGTYKAEVQVFKAASKQWKKKLSPSTFFPRHWSRARIEFEVIEAFKARKLVPGDPAKWRSTSPSGLEIEGFERPDRTTFYPTGKGVVTE